jgi:hypothetical protein
VSHPPLPHTNEDLDELVRWMSANAKEDHSGLLRLIELARTGGHPLVRDGAVRAIRRTFVALEAWLCVEDVAVRATAVALEPTFAGTIAQLLEVAERAAAGQDRSDASTSI